MSMATALSGAVGPLKTRHRQSMAENSSHMNERARKLDCQRIIDGRGRYIMATAAHNINTAPIAHRTDLFI
jgi:hypothetical protein